MDERFPLTEIPRAVAEIAARLLEAGHEAWYVGGAVRDTLLRSTHHALRTGHRGDFDITTSAKPEEVQKLFRRTVPVGIEHGTIAVLDRDNRGHEVTTFRRDVKTDGRHAVVEFGVSLEEDLARRDFTINAMAVHPQTGELRDHFGGRADLASGLLRAVGDPATRFLEDRLRVLRGLRFAATFSLEFDPATWAATRASAAELAHLSRERVRDELMKMLRAAPDSGAAVGLWRRAGVLEAVWPEMRGLSDRQLEALGALPPDPVLITAAALAWSGVTERAGADGVTRLRFSNKDVARIGGIIAGLADAPPAPTDSAALRRWVSKHRPVAADVALALHDPDARGPMRAAVGTVMESGAPLAIGELAINGGDLAAEGVAAGPEMGAILRRLLDDVLEDPQLNTRDTLLARVRALRTA